MQLVEHHIISRNDPRFAKLDAEAYVFMCHWLEILYTAIK